MKSKEIFQDRYGDGISFKERIGKGPHHNFGYKIPGKLTTQQILSCIASDYVDDSGRLQYDKGYSISLVENFYDNRISSPIDENTGLINYFGFYDSTGETLNKDVYSVRDVYVGGSKYLIFSLNNGTEYVYSDNGLEFIDIHRYFVGRIIHIFEFGGKKYLIGKERSGNYWLFSDDSRGATQKNIWSIRDIVHEGKEYIRFEVGKVSYGEPYEEFYYLGSDGFYSPTYNFGKLCLMKNKEIPKGLLFPGSGIINN